MPRLNFTCTHLSTNCGAPRLDAGAVLGIVRRLQKCNFKYVLSDDENGQARTRSEITGSGSKYMVGEAGYVRGHHDKVRIGGHGIFAGDAYQDLVATGAKRIVTCNTIAHETNAIDVTRLLADAVGDFSPIGSDRRAP